MLTSLRRRGQAHSHGQTWLAGFFFSGTSVGHCMGSGELIAAVMRLSSQCGAPELSQNWLSHGRSLLCNAQDTALAGQTLTGHPEVL